MKRSGRHYIYQIGIGDCQTADDIYDAIRAGTNGGNPNRHYTQMIKDNGVLVVHDERTGVRPYVPGGEGLFGEGIAYDPDDMIKSISEQLFACPHSEAVIDWFRDIALSALGIGTIKSCIALRDEDVQKDFSHVHVPTYIIHGDKDLIVSKELAKIQHQNISGSKLITLTDSGHGIIYDQLEKFNSIFMNSIRD